MRILLGQPMHENGIEQLRNEITSNEAIDVVLYPEGYISNEQLLEDVCKLAADYKVIIITSYRQLNKDRAIIINNEGKKVLERAKTPAEESFELYNPLTIDCGGLTIGYMLCMEILKGERDFKKIERKIDFIAHPIGVGMFSEDQFNDWINDAKKIAKACNTTVIGTSHADGSYRNCGISIPIAYCIDNHGEPIFISKADTITKILDI